MCGGTDPVPPDGQRVGRVHVPLPVVARLPVPEDLHLEVADHGVHHLPGGERERSRERNREREEQRERSRERGGEREEQRERSRERGAERGAEREEQRERRRERSKAIRPD